MIWITGDKRHLTISQMSDEHLFNTLDYITRNNSCKDIIYGYSAKKWVKNIYRELCNRQIAQLENKITDLRKQNMKLKEEYDNAISEIEELKKLKKDIVFKF